MTSILLYGAIGVIAAVGILGVLVQLQRWGPGISNTRHGERHLHKGNIQRIGGIAMLIVIVPGILILLPISTASIGIVIASIVIVMTGIRDDQRELSALKQFILQLVVIGIIIASGIGLEAISNPFGEVFHLDTHIITLGTLLGRHVTISPLADLFTVLWLILMMNITNWIDGVDGLASSIGGVAALTIFGISLLPHVQQPQTALLAVLLAGTLVGVFIRNRFPAKIFLGTSGSMLTGLLLGVLSILSGSKVATALLVMGVPILDALWVIGRRLCNHVPIWKPDQRHLHHSLVDVGFSHNQVVMILVAISMGFGIIAVTVQSQIKVISLVLLIGILAILGTLIRARKKQYEKKQNTTSHHHDDCGGCGVDHNAHQSLSNEQDDRQDSKQHL